MSLDPDTLIAEVAAVREEADRRWAALEEASARLQATARTLIQVSEALIDDEFGRRMRVFAGYGEPPP